MISIIIPVHNTAQYLNQCLDSILDQSFANWECIMVDDGSFAGSGSICDGYSLKDSRFRTIHQDNKGVSAARNKGMETMAGDLVCFVDSDDYLEPDYLEKMFTAWEDSDWVVSGLIREFEDGRQLFLIPQTTGRFEFISDQAEWLIDLEKKSILFAPHEKFYRSSIIQRNKLRFPEGCSYGEDAFFNYSYLMYSRSVICVAEALYHYRISNTGLTAAFRPDQFNQDYLLWKANKSFHINKGVWNDDVESFLANRLWGIVYDGIFLFPKLSDPPRAYLKDILSIPEINELKKRTMLFDCASWIKYCIIFRFWCLFYLFFRLHSI